jgi:G3E family GTPase
LTLPLVIVGGYLGAGKTTLVNHLLRQAGGRRIAVLVNDFGDISIDADLIEGASDGVLALAGGCVCCSVGHDLVGGVESVARRQPPPDVLLLECSGVGLPAAVARSAALARGVAVRGIVVVVDVTQAVRQGRDTYVGDTVRRQWREADLLLLNQADRADAPTLAEVAAVLAAAAPGVAQVTTAHAMVPPDLVLGVSSRALSEASGAGAPDDDSAPHISWTTGGRYRRPGASAADRFRFFEWPVDDPVDLPALMAALRARAEPAAAQGPLLRAKGFVRDAQGQVWIVQAMGARVSAEPSQARRDMPVGRLVCIAVDAAAGAGAVG